LDGSIQLAGEDFGGVRVELRSAAEVDLNVHLDKVRQLAADGRR
jgi:hypothetical protein